MNSQTVALALLAIIQGIGAGICVDVALVKLPTRYRIGSIAYAHFARGNDLGNGLKVYPYLVVGGGLAVIVFTVIIHIQKVSTDLLNLLYVASLSALGYLLATAKAAPVMWSIRNTPDEQKILEAKLDKFARWHVVRTIFQITAFLSLLWALCEASGSVAEITFILLISTTFVNGLIAAVSFDTALVKLPARHRIGIIPYAEFARGNDLGNGIIVYPALAIVGAVLLLSLIVVANINHHLSQVLPMLYAAAITTTLSFVATAKAAPIMLSLKGTSNDETILKEKLDKFERWNAFRTIFQMITFLLLIWTLVAK